MVGDLKQDTHLEETKSGEFFLGREGAWKESQRRRLSTFTVMFPGGHPTVAVSLGCWS